MMDINGWLTVITVLTAILALMAKEEIFILRHRTTRAEKIVLASCLVIFIPALILFTPLTERYPSLNALTVSWGYEPAMLAFALFYLCFTWILVRILWLKPKGKINKKLINYYIDLLYQKPFEEFFAIFTKHNSIKSIKKHWEAYAPLFYDPSFLTGVYKKRSRYLLEFWKYFDTEKDFKTIFSFFLENTDSVFYEELAENPTVNSLSEYPFLSELLRSNLNQIVSAGLIGLIEDYIHRHLLNQNSASSVYNQKHHYPAIASEGDDLVIYPHIKFIGLMYSVAFEDKVEIQNIRMTFFATITRDLIGNISSSLGNPTGEYPSKGHWLISKILEVHHDWIREYGTRPFNPHSNYNAFINFSFSLCLQQLIDGCNRGKITEYFIAHNAHYHFFTEYFYFATNEKFKDFMEDEVIKNIPIEQLALILEKTLYESFAVSLFEFIERRGMRFGTAKPSLTRLWNFLNKNKLLEPLRIKNSLLP